jgi:Uma2 family endonuclease
MEESSLRSFEEGAAPIMATAIRPPQSQEPPAPVSEPIPPLENGDRLTRAEFERRYDAMPDLKKAELIEGVVYMPSPVAAFRHGGPHFDMIVWLGLYQIMTPGLKGFDNASARMDLDNMPQPDVSLVILPTHGGQARISEDDYIEGAPELVAEVASSSASYDLHVKLHVYRRNAVREYVVWRVRDREIDWFVLREGVYERLPLGPDGLYRSEIFPGLWLDPAALIGGNSMLVAEVTRRGLESPEHAVFVARLAERAEAAKLGT